MESESVKSFLILELASSRLVTQKTLCLPSPMPGPQSHLLDQHFWGPGLQDDIQVRTATHHLSRFLHQTARRSHVSCRAEHLPSALHFPSQAPVTLPTPAFPPECWDVRHKEYYASSCPTAEDLILGILVPLDDTLCSRGWKAGVTGRASLLSQHTFPLGI